MEAPFTIETTIALTNAGGTLETGIQLPYEAGRLDWWSVSSSAAVVEPEIRLYLRNGQTTGGRFLLVSFTPNPGAFPAVDQNDFTDNLSFRSMETHVTTGSGASSSIGDFTGGAPLYAVCSDNVTTTMVLTLSGVAFYPES